MKYIFTFITSAALSGAIVWHLVTDSAERAIELLMTNTEVADLRYFIELQKTPESEVRCKLAKYSVFIADGLDAEESKKSPFLGPSGLGPVTSREITNALGELKANNIREYASNCIKNNGLSK